MSERNPPIVVPIFNPANFIDDSGTLTVDQANALYFRKTIADTDPYLGTFNAGVTVGTGGILTVSNTTDSTAYNSTAAIKNSGGISIAKNAFVGLGMSVADAGSTPLIISSAGKLTINNVTDASSTTDTAASLHLEGGASIEKTLYVAATHIGTSTAVAITNAGKINIPNTTNATSTSDTNAALHTAGGLGVEKTIYAGSINVGNSTVAAIGTGGKLTLNNTTNTSSSSDSSAAEYIAGGLSVAKNIFSGNAKFTLYLSTDQSIADSTETAISWTGILNGSDPGGYWSGGSPTRVTNTTSTNRRLLITYSILSNATSGLFVAFIAVNGNFGVNDQRYASSQLSAGGSSCWPCGSGHVILTPGDYLQLYVFQNSGGSALVGGQFYGQNAKLDIYEMV